MMQVKEPGLQLLGITIYAKELQVHNQLQTCNVFSANIAY
ncbi:hypothetical protein LXJ15735_36580 [Lacrimispora xylanolytica]